MQKLLQQDLAGEARNYLLHAAAEFLKAQEFGRTREVYQILVEAEPEDPVIEAENPESPATPADIGVE